VNLCRACNQDFSSVRVFDRHRAGSHELEWSLDRPDGRRCLSEGEMADLGWERNPKGRWFDPVAASLVREHFERAA
jgi:hypothetical protein